MNKTLVIVISLGVVATFGLFVVSFALTFAATGEKAIAKMTVEEKVYLEKIASLRSGMSLSEVEEVLGPPDRDADGPRPCWNVNENGSSHIAAYFEPEGLQKVRWMNIGRFMYEPELP